MKLTRFGRQEWLKVLMLIICAFCIVISCTILQWMSVPLMFSLFFLLLVIWLGVAWIFRDPDRMVSDNPEILTSPADGCVTDIELIKNESIRDEEIQKMFASLDLVRIGIHTAFSQIHILRMPCSLTILFQKNNNNIVTIGCECKYRDVVFPMILNMMPDNLFSRVSCRLEAADLFAPADRFGMLCYSGRTEVFFPSKSGIELHVKVGDPVIAGQTVLADFSSDSTEKMRLFKPHPLPSL